MGSCQTDPINEKNKCKSILYKYLHILFWYFKYFMISFQNIFNYFRHVVCARKFAARDASISKHTGIFTFSGGVQKTNMKIIEIKLVFLFKKKSWNISQFGKSKHLYVLHIYSINDPILASKKYIYVWHIYKINDRILKK